MKPPSSRGPRDENRGVNNAVVLVDSEENVKAVLDRVRSLGFEGRAAIEFIERQQLLYVLIFRKH